MSKKGILLVNLGTPNSPAVNDVRKYLKEFLMDGRVIDIHLILRTILVKGFIVPFRSPISARLYRRIWDKKTGSPLLHYSNLQQQLLQIELGSNYQVELAMRYQYPSIELALNKLRNTESIKVIPLFPQYASATTGSVYQKAMQVISCWPTIPNLEFVNSFHDHPALIAAFTARGRQYDLPAYEHVLFSFHGLPQTHLVKGDPTKQHCLKTNTCCSTITEANKFCYGAQAYHTAKLIAGQLNIPQEKFTVCFQSRLGSAPWMQPYTSQIINELAAAGKKKILVFCPAFVADCLETVDEIGVEYREAFLTAGGEDLQLVEGLNDSPDFIRVLKDLAIK